MTAVDGHRPALVDRAREDAGARSAWRSRMIRFWPAVLCAAVGLAGAMLLHAAVPAVGALTWAVGLGLAAANLRLLPSATRATRCPA